MKGAGAGPGGVPGQRAAALASRRGRLRTRAEHPESGHPAACRGNRAVRGGQGRAAGGGRWDAALTRGLALVLERRAGAQSRTAPRGGAAGAAEARARGPDGGRLAARAVREAQLPGACALHIPGPRAPGRQAAPSGHARQQAPGGPCGDKGAALGRRPRAVPTQLALCPLPAPLSEAPTAP